MIVKIILLISDSFLPCFFPSVANLCILLLLRLHTFCIICMPKITLSDVFLLFLAVHGSTGMGHKHTKSCRCT